jgi:F0F1-type ATP synthase assembly protein I
MSPHQPVSARPLRPLLLIIAVFVLSRVVFFRAGIRFDHTPLTWFWQYADPDFLRNNLLQTVYYLHSQPPLFNVFLGIILKSFPGHESIVFGLVYKALGLALAVSLFALMRKFHVRDWISIPVTVLFIISPSAILYENWLFYTYPITVLLCVAALFLYRFTRGHRLSDGVFFFALLAIIVLTRSMFHLLWFVLFLIVLVYHDKLNRKRIITACLIPLILVSALYIKNLVLFGSFTSSTWLGLSFAKFTTLRLSENERKALIDEGRISELNLIHPYSDFDEFRAYIRSDQKTGIPILDQEKKIVPPHGSSTNYNHIGFIQISRQYFRDGLTVLRLYPETYVQSIMSAFSIYFFPSSTLSFLDANREHIRRLDEFYNSIFYGQILPPASHPGVEDPSRRYTETYYERISKVGIFLIAGVLVAVIYGWLLVSKALSQKPLDLPRALTILFIYANVIYVTIVGNIAELAENQRYRFTIDPLFLVILALLVNELVAKRKASRRGS